MNVSEADGGPGGTLYDLMIVAEEIAAAGIPLMMLVVSPGLCAPVLAEYGTPEQRARWLAPIGSGDVQMAFVVTEPDAGSNTHNISTRAERTEGGWLINGSKYYISGLDDADAIMVVARTGEDAVTGRGRLSLFIVDIDSPGLGTLPIATQVKAGERQFTVTFDDVFVPDTHLVAEEGAGLRALFVGLNPERIISAAVCLGLARFALNKGVDYAKTRNVWGVPIGQHQAVAHSLAKARVALESATLHTRRAATLQSDGEDAGVAANMAKLVAAEAAAECLDAAIQVHGGNGLADEYGLADLWGVVRLYSIAPVSKEMILNHIAQQDLGLPKSY